MTALEIKPPNDIAEAQAKPLAGLVLAYRFYPDGSSEVLNVEQPVPAEGGWLWLHFNLADNARQPILGHHARTLPTRRGRFWSPATSISSCKGAKPAFTASLPISSAGWSGPTEEIGFLHFALTERVFISSRRHQLNAIEATRKALRLGAKVQSPAALLELIAGQMIELLDHFSDGLADQLERAEERILADELNVDRKVVGSARRTTVRLHRQVVTLRSLIQRFEHGIEEVEDSALNLTDEEAHSAARLA